MERVKLIGERKTSKLSKILYKINCMLHPKKRRKNLVVDNWMYGYDYK